MSLNMSVMVMKFKCKWRWYFASERAVSLGQDTQRIPFKDRSWLGYKTRSSK